MKKRDIKDFSRPELEAWLKERKIAPYRAGQIFKWIYIRQADSFEEMTDLGKELRALLVENYTIPRLEKANVEISSDGTRKYLFRLADGEYTESVLIPGKDRKTLCISSQVGCAQGCKFCLTAQGGFKRNLTAGEIIGQVRDVLSDLPMPEGAAETEKPFQNIVFMGMGEPLANLPRVLTALSILTDGDYGLRFSARRITVSTCGLVGRLPDLGANSPVNLAVSLNATDNTTRSALMPVNDTYPIETLLSALGEYPLRHREKITIEYILMKGINDTDEDAARLIRMLRPLSVKINLLPFNEHEGSDFKRPDDAAVDHFLQLLHDAGYTAIVRQSKGQDISAACGQLRANQLNKTSDA
ncbi:23S rRNA (adenine(2503)-C(2))-methyltransferase RlmN [Desulfoluna spongiiphila]|uniref:23S rRNA (adenine(2503)-C(2))-methyltransferase RlmN n=1 Tax=Desulfoluna spongiiphila TaxID=419481 RepID=UPI0012583CD3|nr:23S rRNA (adenine(2503)-C(2))-methyltransferase RlmN [Desulfoluna spongiiphila]VVS93572.1 ribosomal rna large subunit methyltransferase rlmn/cfr [Desulfoluna spongiiphila]